MSKRLQAAGNAAFNAAVDAAAKVAKLPLPLWAKLVVTVVAGVTAAYMYVEPSNADAVANVLNTLF